MHPLENPLAVLFFGALWIAVAAVAWTQTHDRRALLALLAGIALTVTGLVVERLVMTPREEIAAVLQQVAQALEANDSARVLGLLAPSATELQAEVRQRMRLVRFLKVSIKRNLEVQLGAGNPPNQAEARFNVVGTLDGPSDYGKSLVVPRFLIVQFVREGTTWRIASYQDFDPRGPGQGERSP
jgi:hypothetical protein